MIDVNNVGSKIEKIIELTMDISSNIASFQARIRELEDKLSILNTFKEVNYYIGVEKEIKNVIRIIIDVVMGVLGVTSCSINILHNGHWEINESSTLSDGSRIITEETIQELNNEIDKRSGELIIRDLSTFEFIGLKTGSLLALSLSRSQNKFGVITVYYNNSDVINELKLEFFKLLSKQLEIHLENAFLFEKIKMASISDELTGLFNRMHLNEILFKKSTLPISDIGVIMIDIDNFKRINDTHGHLYGDSVIQEISGIIRSMEKKYAVTGFRYGGEEFLILCEHLTLDRMIMLAEELRVTFNNISHSIEGGDVHFSMSLGIALFEMSSKILDINALIDAADVALYYSKHNGKNRYTVSTGDIQLYMKSNPEIIKVRERIRRNSPPYFVVKIKVKVDNPMSRSDHTYMVNTVNKIFRMYDSVFHNNLGEFFIILEISDNIQQIIEERVKEGFSNSGFVLDEISYATITQHDFEISELFDFRFDVFLSQPNT